jgi:hypothetical protein
MLNEVDVICSKVLPNHLHEELTVSDKHADLRITGFLVDKHMETITMDDLSGRRCRPFALTAGKLCDFYGTTPLGIVHRICY